MGRRSLIKDYSGVPDCARIVNMFHFAVAKLGLASLWIDYVPSEDGSASPSSSSSSSLVNEEENFMQ